MKKCECGCGEPAPIAKMTITKRGIVKGQSLQFCHGHHNRTKTWTNYNTFEDMEALGHYLLGVWLGDGCVYLHTNGYKYVTLSSIDKDWLISIQKEVFPASNVGVQRKVNKKKNWKTLYRLRKADERLAAWLIAHNCTERKSMTLTMPKINKLWTADFIRGLIDSDGSITYGYRKIRNKSYRYGVIAITTSSKKFAEEIQKLLIYCRFPATIGRLKSKGKTHYQVHVTQKEKVKTMCKWLYGTSNHIHFKCGDVLAVCLQRKREKAKKLIEFLS